MKAFLLLVMVAMLTSLHAADPAPPESVRGRILQVLKDGVLLDCRSGDYINNSDQTDGLNLKDVQGIVFLSGHPGQGDFIDEQRVGVTAVRTGTYKYTTALGAEKTVAAYKFVKVASSR